MRSWIWCSMSCLCKTVISTTVIFVHINKKKLLSFDRYPRTWLDLFVSLFPWNTWSYYSADGASNENVMAFCNSYIMADNNMEVLVCVEWFKLAYSIGRLQYAVVRSCSQNWMILAMMKEVIQKTVRCFAKQSVIKLQVQMFNNEAFPIKSYCWPVKKTTFCPDPEF